MPGSPIKSGQAVDEIFEVFHHPTLVRTNEFNIDRVIFKIVSAANNGYLMA